MAIRLDYRDRPDDLPKRFRLETERPAGSPHFRDGRASVHLFSTMGFGVRMTDGVFHGRRPSTMATAVDRKSASFSRRSCPALSIHYGGEGR